MHIESIAIERINPAAYNPRIDLRPGDPDYDRLQRSMEEFGFVEPLVWNRRIGNLVGGHQRLKILAARGVKCIEVSVVDLPPDGEQALNVALNKIGGDWDERKLADLLTGLAQIPDFDVSLTGFDSTEITHLLDKLEAIDDEDDFDLADALEAAEGRPPVTTHRLPADSRVITSSSSTNGRSSLPCGKARVNVGATAKPQELPSSPW